MSSVNSAMAEMKPALPFREILLASIVGGFLSGTTWAVGRSLVDHDTMVRLAHRSIFLGSTAVKTAILLLLLVADFAAVAACVYLSKREAHRSPGRAFDVIVIVYGLTGSMLALVNWRSEIVYWWGSFSEAILLLALFGLLQALSGSALKTQRLTFVCYAVANAAPGIAFLRIFYRG